MIASELGFQAVEELMRGGSSVMAGIENNEVVFVPFEEAINNEKIPPKSLQRMASILSM
jgi:6-phosphofructokinase 1